MYTNTENTLIKYHSVFGKSSKVTNGNVDDENEFISMPYFGYPMNIMKLVYMANLTENHFVLKMVNNAADISLQIGTFDLFTNKVDLNQKST